MQNFYLLCACVFAFTAVAAVVDFRTRRLPNWLTVSALAAALVFHTVSGFVVGGLPHAGYNLLMSLAGFATGFGVLFVLWLIGSTLGGDVKFMGALGAWLMPTMTLWVFAVSGALVAVFLVLTIARRAFSGKLRVDLRASKIRKGMKKQQDAGERKIIPYGVYLAFATWAVLAFQIIAPYWQST